MGPGGGVTVGNMSLMLQVTMKVLKNFLPALVTLIIGLAYIAYTETKKSRG